MNRTKSAIIGVLVVVAGVASIGLMMANKPLPPKKPPQATSPLVEVIVPQAEFVQFQIEAHGVVQPRTETSLVSEVSGVVIQVSEKFVAGGLFNQGEIILQIDPSDYEVSVEQSKARLAGQEALLEQEKARVVQAQKEWDMTGRSRKNAPALALRKPFLLEAEANVQSAEADLKKAEQKLARTIIRSPYKGMVKAKNVDIGQFVSMGTPLGEVFAIDYAEVRLPLTDSELAFIELPKWGEKSESSSTKVSIRANYAGNQVEWKGSVVRMEGTVDSQSRVHYIVARIPDPYGVINTSEDYSPLKVGTFVTASIQGNSQEGLIKLPRNVFRDLSKVLVSDDNNQLYIRDLDIVRAESENVYVKAGLQLGDRIVTTSMPSPVQGTKVRIQGEDVEVEDTSDSENKEAYANKVD